MLTAVSFRFKRPGECPRTPGPRPNSRSVGPPPGIRRSGGSLACKLCGRGIHGILRRVRFRPRLLLQEDTHVYIGVAEALEEIDSPQPAGSMGATVTKVREKSNMLQALGVDITEEELESAFQLVKGHVQVEVPGLEERGKTGPKRIGGLHHCAMQT